MSTVRLTAGSSSGRVLEEVDEIIDLMVPQAEGAREPVPTAWCGAGHGVLRYASVEVLHHVPDFRERAVAEEGASVLELPKHHHAELEGVRAVESDLRPFLDRGSSLASLLKAWIGWSPIPTLMKFSSTNWPIPVTSGSLLLVEHRAAVAGEATRPARRTGPAFAVVVVLVVRGRGREEEPGSAPLCRRQGAVVPSQEPVKRRVPCDRGSHEGRRGPQDGQVVDQQVQVAGRVSLGGLLGERVPEELPVGGDLLQYGHLSAQTGLRVVVAQHPVGVDQEQRHAFLRREVERVQAPRGRIGFACEPPQQDAVVERGSEHTRRIARDAVQGIQPAGS